MQGRFTQSIRPLKKDKLNIHCAYEGHSKSFATQYDAQMTQAKFLCYYST